MCYFFVGLRGELLVLSPVSTVFKIVYSGIKCSAVLRPCVCIYRIYSNARRL